MALPEILYEGCVESVADTGVGNRGASGYLGAGPPAGSAGAKPLLGDKAHKLKTSAFRVLDCW